MMAEQPDFILNIRLRRFDYSHAALRIHTARANVERYKIPMFYTNNVGAQTDVIFDGGSIVMSPDGLVFDEMPYFEECLRVYELAEVQQGGRSVEQPKEKITLIHDALVVGIRDYFRKLGFKKAILGLSGGIDSAVTAVLAARKPWGRKTCGYCSCPASSVAATPWTMPANWPKNLEIQYDIVPIRPIFEAFESALKPYFEHLPFNVTKYFARIRGTLLMAMSNKFGHILLNTTNKSEMAVGYGTLYGDLCGGLSVLADVYKTEVYDLARYLNTLPLGTGGKAGVIPRNSIEKPPSAGLRPGRKTATACRPTIFSTGCCFSISNVARGRANWLHRVSTRPWWPVCCVWLT